MFLAYTALLVFASTSAFGLSSFPEWCVVPSTVHVRQNETCKTMESVASNKIVWHAMIGEQESKQILLDLESWPAKYNLTAAFSLITNILVRGSGEILRDLDVISWWQVGYVNCNHTTSYLDSGGGWRPDPLLTPLTGSQNGAILLESGITQPIWINIQVPYSLPSGEYKGNVTLVIGLPNDETLVQNVSIDLTVWNITLPPLNRSKFPAIFNFELHSLETVYGKESSTVKFKFYDLLTDQRVGGNDLYTGVPTNVSLAAYLAGKGIQWLSLYDVYGAAGIGESSRRVKGACINFTDNLVQKALDILTPVVSDYEKEGLLGNMFVYGFDEAPASCEESVRKIYGAIKEKWPQLRTVATLNWLPSTDLPLDVWVLQYEFYNETEASVWTAAGKQQWWYHCIEPSGTEYLNTFIERPLIMARLLFWLASAHQVGGWLYYSDVMWQRHPPSSSPMERINSTARTDFDPANYIWLPRTDIFANGDGNFVYPSSTGPIPTIRLHNLRDGFEDAELFRMLDLDKVGPIVQPLVRSPTDYTLDPILLEKQRVLAASMIQAKHVH